MSLFVGIDIAKHTHFASIIDLNGVVICDPFSFENSKDGFLQLLSVLSSYPKDNLLLGFESTAHYSNNLSNFLLSNAFTVGILNPYQTSALRKTRMRDTKNDKIDSLIIAQALSLNLHTLLSPYSLHNELHGLCRAYRNIMTLRSRSKIQYVTYLDQTFPELASFFKGNLHLNTAYQLLKKYDSPSKIGKARLSTLTKLLTVSSHGRYKQDQAIKLKELTHTTIGIESASLAFQIRLAIDQIELYTNQLEEIKEQISTLVLSLDSPIMSIPGMGIMQAAMILSSIKNINLFSAPCKVLAFAGLDPRVRQSGNFTAVSTRMSKRGNSMLRYALIYAAHNVVKNNKTFKEYYDLKISQGRRHYNALGHVAHKLVRVIYKMLSENQTFNLE